MQPIRRFMLIVIAAVFAVYAPSFGNGFAMDDKGVVRVPSISPPAPNNMVRDIRPLGEYFTTPYTDSFGGHGRGFRPFTTLSFAIVHDFTEDPNAPPEGPLAPAGPQHVVNVLLHCAATWLCFELLALLFGLSWPALIGAAIFGLHALRSDPVISLVGRSEIQGFLFGAAGLLFYVRALRSAGGRRVGLTVATGLSMFLAFGSKESSVPWVVMLPLFVSALRWSSEEHEASLPRLMGQLPVFAGGVLLPLAIFFYLLFGIWSRVEEFEPAFLNNPAWFLETGARMASGLIILAYALGKCLLPWTLSCDYGNGVFDLAEGFFDPRAMAALALFAAMLGVGLWRARRDPPLLLAVAFFFGFTFLTSNIPIPIETVFGERLFYTPALILSLLAGFAYAKLEAKPRLVLLAVLGLWGLFCAARIVQRDFAWRDTRTLFEADLQSQPRSLLLRMGLMKYVKEADPRAWKESIDYALSVDPGAPEPNLEQGVFLQRVGDLPGAAAAITRGIESKQPDVKLWLPQLHQARAGVFERMGRLDVARQDWIAAARAAGDGDPQYAIGLAGFHLRRGERDVAAKLLEQICARNPGSVDAWELRLTMAEEDRDDARITQLIREARPFLGDNPWLSVHEGMMLFRRGDTAAALRALERGVSRLPRDPRTFPAWLSFAKALAAIGRVNEARQIVGEWLQGPFPPQIKQAFHEFGQTLR